MIEVELGHLGVTFECELSYNPSTFLWCAYCNVSKYKTIGAEGKSPALAIEALRNKFHEEEK